MYTLIFIAMVTFFSLPVKVENKKKNFFFDGSDVRKTALQITGNLVVKKEGIPSKMIFLLTQKGTIETSLKKKKRRKKRKLVFNYFLIKVKSKVYLSTKDRANFPL